MICKNCGFNVNEGAFCPNCGTPVEQATITVEEPVYDNPEPVKNNGKTMGIIALILSILAILSATVCSCVCCFGTPISFVLALAGIILSALAMKSSKAAGMKNGMAVTALILSIVAFVLMIVFGILSLVMGLGTTVLSSIMSALGSATSNSVDYYDYYYDPYYYY